MSSIWQQHHFKNGLCVCGLICIHYNPGECALMSYGWWFGPQFVFLCKANKNCPVALASSNLLLCKIFELLQYCVCRSSPHANEVWCKVVFNTCVSFCSQGGVLAPQHASQVTWPSPRGLASQHASQVTWPASSGVCLQGGCWADPLELDKRWAVHILPECFLVIQLNFILKFCYMMKLQN